MNNSNISRRDILRAGGTMALGAAVGGGAAPAAPVLPREDITADDAIKAIGRAVEFLQSRRQSGGTWPNMPHYGEGLTGLCTLALLHAGCSPQDAAMQNSLNYLRGLRPNFTYTAAFQTMALCRAEPENDYENIRRNAVWLEKRQVQFGSRRGMWAAPSPGSRDHVDNSMTHAAMLALYEAQKAGAPVSERTWLMALESWQRSQNADGSWGWGPGHEGSGSMTCAGIASVIIAAGQFGEGDARVEGDNVYCCGERRTSPHVEKALDWLERHFSVHRNPAYEFWHSYYLYSLERAGRLTAQRFIGRHDWYREAAKALVDSQLSSGAWPPDKEFLHVDDANVSTSFSLMFLAKGRWPALLAHLKHEPDDDWNRHRGALFNFIGCVEKAWGMRLTYQVIDASAATVEDLLETPVVYISGRDAPRLDDDEKQKLRMYVDRGGFIFAEQCCGGGSFDRGFRELMQDIFPGDDAQMRLLPPQHPVWHAEQKIDPRYLCELWGIDVGCRTGVVYCPQDLACYWELARLGREAKYSQVVQEQIEAARGVGLNVLAYATNREVKFKNPAYHPAEANNAAGRGGLFLANVVHPGGCYAAPAALKNLLRLFSLKYGAPTGRRPGEVRLSDGELFEFHLVFFHGREEFQLTAAERDNLREYLRRGGMMFADAICSSREFSSSFRAEMEVIFPEISLRRIPPDDPFFTARFGGEEIASVSRRELVKKQNGEPADTVVHREEPHLEGLKIDDYYAVVFSPYDVSCALTGRETLGCDGYARADAVKIAVNMLFYSCH